MDYKEKDIQYLLPQRPENSNKGTFGHVLNIAGSFNYRGAAYFSSLAPLKVGCGLVTLAGIESVINSVSALTPDVIFLPLKGKKSIRNSSEILAKVLDKYQVISVGCGLSTDNGTIKFFEKLIKILAKIDIPIVIDADGLNILAMFNEKPPIKNLILTPHPKELARLLGINSEAVISAPDFFVRKCSEEYNCTTVLKLHETIISNKQGKIRTNETGNSALAHGGSGDVLTGMISGLLAQGMAPYEASILAVYLHGKTAMIASKKLGEYSVLSSDLLDYIHSAMSDFS